MAILGDTTILIANEDSSDVLEGRIFVQLARILQKRVDVSRLKDYFTEPEINEAITTFLNRGIAQTRPPSGDPFIDAFWDSTRVQPAATATIAVKSLIAGPSAWLRAALQANGLTVADNADRILVVTDDYLHPGIDECARECTNWILAKPIGHTIWLGPWFTSQSVCWNCVAHWIRVNRQIQFGILGPGADGQLRQRSTAALPSTIGLSSSLLATAAAMWCARNEYPELQDVIVTLDTRNLTWTRHSVRPGPGCQNCLQKKRRPVRLDDLVSRVCGIVSRLAITSEPSAWPFAACAQVTPPLPVRSSRSFLRNLTVCGRGPSRYVAEQSCIGEAVERYSAVFQGDESMRRARIGELGGNAISPSELFLFSEAQYRDRESWNRRCREPFEVPDPFDPATSIDWTPVRSPVNGCIKFVPSAYCYLWYESQNSAQIYKADSMGCASGPTHEAAIEAALLELIERDAVSIWWDNRLLRPAWEITAFGQPELNRCSDALRNLGRTMELLDVTTDLGVPVCVAVGARFDGSEPLFAASAGLSAETAATRAASELLQILSLKTHELTLECRDWVETGSASRHPYLTPAGYKSPPQTKLNIERCLEALIAAKLEPFVLDLTRPEIGVPAVRVIVPGLRHPWHRYAPGRLYSVPVKMGWLPQANAERDLNPAVCIL